VARGGVLAKADQTKKKTTEVVDQRLVKALGHPLRAQVLSILNERTASPVELSKMLGERLTNVSYHVRQLQRYGCIELVEERPVRGANEHFYRGVTRSFLSDENWRQLSPEAQAGISVAGMKMINKKAMEALLAETFDKRQDRHLSCTPLVLDEEGWQAVGRLLAATLEGLMKIQTQSAGRLAEKGETGVPATVSILGFESPDR
jgi:DNA-binding transcriptional ArsR family regulator